MEQKGDKELKNEIIDLHHIGFVVSNIDRSLAFYEKIGFNLKMRWEESPEECEEGLGVPGAHIELAQLFGHGFLLELMSYLKPSTESNKNKKNNSIGNAHITLRVKNIDNAYEAFSQLGGKPISKIQRFRGADWVHFKDPDGYVIELIKLWEDKE